MSDRLVVSGAAQGMLPALLLRAASVYTSPLQALLEYFQNGLDEPTTRKMWAYLDRKNNRILIGDDGTGMGGAMSGQDTELVDLFYSIIASGDSPGCDLRDIVSEPATHTLEWLIRNIANSVKSTRQAGQAESLDPRLHRFLKAAGMQARSRQRRATMGKFGIGAWAFLSLANKIIIASKPNPTLAASLGVKLGTRFVIYPPTKTQLSSFNLGFEIKELSEEITDLYGNNLLHGTVVSIEEITEEAWDHLSVDSLVAYLRDIFGSRIENSGIEITVADDTGRVEIVPPQVIRGRILVDDTFESIDGSPCSILVYYDPKSRNLTPRITKLGVTICLLTDIIHKGTSPFGTFWASGRVGGRIAFEHLERGDDDLFDTSKHGIIDSAPRRFWINKIKELEKQIDKKIKEIEAEEANERLSLSAMIINRTLKTALENQGIMFPGMKRLETAKGETTERQPRKPLQNIIIQVVDRNGRGVEGVLVNLRLPPSLEREKSTGPSGMIQFGNPQPGEYRVRIETNHPVKGGIKTTRFVIDPKQGILGKRVRFVLETGDAKQRLSAPQIEVAFNVWDDPGEPWRQAINTLHVIEVNIGPETELRQQLDWEHFAIADSMMAEYTTAAIMEALSEAGEHASRIRQSALFTELLTSLEVARNQGTRAARKKKKINQ